MLNTKKIFLIIICAILCVQVSRFSIADEDKKPVEQKKSNDLLKSKTDTDKEAEDAPNISVKEPVYNFGKVYRGIKVEHVFRFKNEGQGELKIEKARTSCGCTAAIISSKNIPHNEYGEVKVTFNTQSYTGKVTKKVTLYSNDPDTPKYKLTITGTVIEEVAVKPKRLDFSKIAYETGSTKDISVKSITDLKLKIKKVESTNPNVIATIKEDKEKGGFIVNVSLKKETDYGKVNGNILIFTNSKHQEKITVPFYGEIIGDLSIYPPRLSIGVISSKKEMVFPAFVIVYNNDVNIEKVEATPDFIETVLTETKTKRKRRTYKIETIFRKNSPAGKVNGNLRIFTNSKRQPVIEIPIIGMINEG
ncbi:MAG: DUF1573 domain-containing protein [Candidatus Anammoxibacter sp.]